MAQQGSLEHIRELKAEVAELKELNDKLTDYDKQLSADAIEKMLTDLSHHICISGDGVFIQYDKQDIIDYADKLRSNK